MKHLNSKRTWAGAVLILSMALMLLNMNACASKKNNDAEAQPPAPTNPWNPNCPNCYGGGGGQLLKSGFGQSPTNSIVVGVDVLAQNGLPPSGGYYSGGAVVVGQALIQTATSGSVCPVIPPGNYQINTVQPGQWRPDVNGFTTTRVELIGPTRVNAMIYGYVYPGSGSVNFNGRPFTDRIYAEIGVEAVNGVPCNPSVTGFSVN